MVSEWIEGIKVTDG